MTIDVPAGRVIQEKTVALTSMTVPALHATIMLLASTKWITTLVRVLRDLADHTVNLISMTAF